MTGRFFIVYCVILSKPAASCKVVINVTLHGVTDGSFDSQKLPLNQKKPNTHFGQGKAEGDKEMRLQARKLAENDPQVCVAGHKAGEYKWPAVVFAYGVEEPGGEKRDMPLCQLCLISRGLCLSGEGNDLVLSDEVADIEAELAGSMVSISKLC